MRTHANQLKGKAADGEIPNVMAICTETNDYSNFSIWKVKMDRLSWDCTCHCQTDICTPIIPRPRFGKVQLRIKPETCEEDDQR